jgi:HK97 gp10 family phage protein
MAVQFKVTIEGFEALKNRLQRLPERLRTNIMRGAMRAAVAVLRRLARDNVQQFSRTGNLRRSIRVSTRSFRNGTVTGTVKAGGPRAYYANIVEVGARPHAIRVKRANALALGPRTFVKAVQHPGFAGRRYMQQAAERGEKPASDAFAAYVQQRVVKFMATGQA